MLDARFGRLLAGSSTAMTVLPVYDVSRMEMWGLIFLVVVLLPGGYKSP